MRSLITNNSGYRNCSNFVLSYMSSVSDIEKPVSPSNFLTSILVLLWEKVPVSLCALHREFSPQYLDLFFVSPLFSRKLIFQSLCAWCISPSEFCSVFRTKKVQFLISREEIRRLALVFLGDCVVNRPK